VYLNQDITVGSLQFTPSNGCNLFLGSHNLTLMDAVGNVGSGHCVITDGSGVVIRSISGAVGPGQTFGFPIGPSAGKWNCVQLTNQSGNVHTYSGRVVTSVADVANVETTAKVTWYLKCDGDGVSTDIQTPLV